MAARTRGFVSIVAVVALSLVATTGQAQAPPPAAGDEEQRANELFREATQLQDQGQDKKACAKFVESYRLSPRVAALQKVAQCHVAEGKLATARAELNRVIQMARSAGQAEAVSDAQKLLAEIEPKVSWLTVLLTARLATIEGLYITVNGRALSREKWGRPIAVDPGEYQIEAAAPGFKPWSQTVPVRGGGDRRQATVQLEPLQQAALPPPTPVPAAPPPRQEPPPAEEPPETLPYEEGEPVPAGYHPQKRIRTGLVIGGSITFGVLYLGSVLAAASDSSSDEGEDRPIFGEEGREPMYIPLVGPFITLGTADPNDTGTAILVVDGLGQVAGMTMLIVGLAAQRTILARDQQSAAQLQLAPRFGRHGIGLDLSGTL